MSNMKSMLTEAGISPSPQRMNIFRFLCASKDHPSAEDIYDSLLPDIPTLSRTTVYNTLKLFVSKGLILKIPVGSGEARFDSDTSCHAHFECRSCGKLFDVAVDDRTIPFPQLDNFLIEETTLIARGLCPSCYC